MNSIYNSDFLKEVIDITYYMYNLGWNERNGGNLSYLIEENEVRKYIDVNNIIRSGSLGFDASSLSSRYFLVTGSGKYFRNVDKNPSDCLGLIRISKDGKKYELLWGLSNGGVPTSELPTHLMSHVTRLKVDPNHRVIIHCHATNIISLTVSTELIEKKISRILWKMSSECIVVFPEGVGIVPWMVPGTTDIGLNTAEKFKKYRLVIWPNHGVYGSGETVDEAFGLIETAEKSAQIYNIANSGSGIRNEISDDELIKISNSFGVQPKFEFINGDVDNGKQN